MMTGHANRFIRIMIPALWIVIGAMLPAVLRAQESDPETEKTVKYTSATSLSLVLTRGNNQDFLFSLDTDQNLEFHKNRINLKGRFIDSRSQGEKTSEIYYSQLKFDRKITSKAYLLGFVRYERNILSGYSFRIALSAGGGISWIQSPKHQLSSELAFGWNNEREHLFTTSATFPELMPTTQLALTSSFLSSVMTHKWVGRISESAQIIMQEILFWNLEETRDIRLDSYIEISSAINRHLALKSSLQIIYAHQPVETYQNTDLFLLSSLVIKF